MEAEALQRIRSFRICSFAAQWAAECQVDGFAVPPEISSVWKTD